MNYELASKLLATKKDLKNVKVFLEECSEAYYNQDSIIISDKQYDELYRKYKEYREEMAAEIYRKDENLQKELK